MLTALLVILKRICVGSQTVIADVMKVLLCKLFIIYQQPSLLQPMNLLCSINRFFYRTSL